MSRILPHALDSERHVLGSALVGGQPIVDVALDYLVPEDFYVQAHAHIWRAILSVSSRLEAVDTVTVRAELVRAGVLGQIGGDDYLLGLTDTIPNVHYVETHARIVQSRARLRALITACQNAIVGAYENPADAEAFIDMAEAKIYAAAHQRESSSAAVMIGDVLKECVDEMRAASSRGDALLGLPTGLADLDRLTNGWMPGNLVIVAARPGMGKTAFALKCAREAAGCGKLAAIFSLEMRAVALGHRLIAAEADIPHKKWISGVMQIDEARRADEAIRRLHKLPIIIEGSPSLSLPQIRARARRFAAERGRLDLIIIDYLQLMRSGDRHGSREEEVAAVSRGLKALALELEVPVIALAQLNRSVESRSDKRPMISDIRESGQIEQDADIICFLYRDEYYNDASVHRGVAEVIVAKQRSGATGTIRAAFNPSRMKFSNLSRREDFDDNFPAGAGMSGKDAAAGGDR